MTRTATVDAKTRAGLPKRRPPHRRRQSRTTGRLPLTAGIAAVICIAASGLAFAGSAEISIGTGRAGDVRGTTASLIGVGVNANAEGGAASRLTPLVFEEDGHTVRLATAAGTVAEALAALGVVLNPADHVIPPPDTPVTPGQKITLRRAKQVRLQVHGRESSLFTRASTVGEFLAASGIAISPGEHLSSPPGAPIIDGMPLRISRERQEVFELLESVPFQSVRRLDPSLPQGETRREPGRRGILHREVRMTMEIDRVIGREVLREWIDPHPQDEIVYVGTRQDPAPLAPVSPEALVRESGAATAVAQATLNARSTPTASATPMSRQLESASLSARPQQNMDNRLPNGRRIRVYATWYSAASTGTPKDDPMYGITTTGARVDRGIVAVDPKVIPLGTRLFIPGYGHAVAADTGSAVIGHIIDLGFPDAVTPNWEPRWLEIIILE